MEHVSALKIDDFELVQFFVYALHRDDEKEMALHIHV